MNLPAPCSAYTARWLRAPSFISQRPTRKVPPPIPIASTGGVSECPRHIIIFNPSALEKMLASVGFGKIRIVQEPVTKDLARSAISRDMDAGREPMQDVNARASDGLLNLRFAVSGRLAAWRARSDRIHAFAAKGSAS